MSISISSYLVKKKITFLPIRVAHFLKKNLNGKHLTILITMLFPKVWLQAEYKLTTTGTFRNISGITEGGVLSKKKKKTARPPKLPKGQTQPPPQEKKKKILPQHQFNKHFPIKIPFNVKSHKQGQKSESFLL